MNNNTNEKKINDLSKKYNGIDIKSLQEEYFKYLEYLKDNCELNLRIILRKYYNNEELSEEDKQKIGRYVLYSNPSIFSSEVDGPSISEIMLKSSYGSGNFSNDERITLANIHNEVKLKGKR